MGKNLAEGIGNEANQRVRVHDKYASKAWQLRKQSVTTYQ